MDFCRIIESGGFFDSRFHQVGAFVAKHGSMLCSENLRSGKDLLIQVGWRPWRRPRILLHLTILSLACNRVLSVVAFGF